MRCNRKTCSTGGLALWCLASLRPTVRGLGSACHAPAETSNRILSSLKPGRASKNRQLVWAYTLLHRRWTGGFGPMGLGSGSAELEVVHLDSWFLMPYPGFGHGTPYSCQVGGGRGPDGQAICSHGPGVVQPNLSLPFSSQAAGLTRAQAINGGADAWLPGSEALPEREEGRRRYCRRDKFNVCRAGRLEGQWKRDGVICSGETFGLVAQQLRVWWLGGEPFGVKATACCGWGSARQGLGASITWRAGIT